MTTTTPDLSPFTDFESASRAVLRFLGERTGLGLWMITRTEGDEWIVLQSCGHGYDIADGDVFRWADSFCSLMVAGRGPQAVADLEDVPVYLDAPIGRELPIAAYLGVPVMRGNGELFGTLCAIDPKPQPETLVDELPLVRLLSRLLGTVLDADMRQLELTRELEASREAALHDSLTGLLNRRGWEERLLVEERRARRYGSPAAVFIIDLDRLKEINDNIGHDAGDLLLTRAAQILRETLRESDAIARIGGDEFAVLCMECGMYGQEPVVRKVRDALVQADIEASMGWAPRDPRKDLATAVIEADRAMLAEKRVRRGDER